MTKGVDIESPALLEAHGLGKTFGGVVALRGVSLSVRAGEVVGLLGDNGAGKSTLIKCLAGVHRPDEGSIVLDGTPVSLENPREALALGIATVYQDLAMIPLMSIARNFVLGSEPMVGRGILRRFDAQTADRVARRELARMGIDIRSTTQAVGTLSGGERQSLAIARAVYFGARLLILDEPTSALGVKEAAIVLRYVDSARERGVGVIFITHNVRHAWAVSNKFTILNRGRSYGTFRRGEVSRDDVLHMMAGGSALDRLRSGAESNDTGTDS